MKATLQTLCGALAGLAMACPLPLLAQQTAHVHGRVSLDVALDGALLTLHLDAPLDSLLGFEHRPRSAAQRQSADALLKRFQEDTTLIRPAAAAQCTAVMTTVESAALLPAAGAGIKEHEHADLDARFEFNCQRPELLTVIDLGLFDAFKRIQQIEVQVARAKGQSKVTLKRPNGALRLGS